jgi:hypothetical protein
MEAPLRSRNDPAAPEPTHWSGQEVIMNATADPAPCSAAGHDILDHVAVSVPCGACGGRYPVSLRHILLAQDMLHEGCPVCDERECPPLSYAPLATRQAIDAFERAWTALAHETRSAGWELTLLPPRR